MHHEDVIAVVEAWQAAANQADIERLLSLSDANIEIVGPRGAAHGHQVLRDWMGRAGLTLTTQRLFAKGDTVVAAQHGVWRSVETGKFVGASDVASRFRVTVGKVGQYARHDTLAEALHDAGLNEQDEVQNGM